MYGVDDDGVIFRRDTRAARRSERYDLNRAGTTASVSPPNLRYGARRHDGQAGAVSTARLDELIAEATVDCYNEEEQLTGLFTLIEDNVALPFETNVLGVSVTRASM